REEILTDVKQSPGKGGKRDVRKFMLKMIAEEAPKLLQYHATARINAAILLADLSDSDYSEEEGDARKPTEPCTRGAEPLIKLVKDRAQLTAVRIWGVNGLVRLAMLPELKLQLRSDIVETLVAQLNGSGREHEWYQMRLAEGLGKVNVARNQDR